MLYILLSINSKYASPVLKRVSLLVYSPKPCQRIKGYLYKVNITMQTEGHPSLSASSGSQRQYEKSEMAHHTALEQMNFSFVWLIFLIFFNKEYQTREAHLAKWLDQPFTLLQQHYHNKKEQTKTKTCLSAKRKAFFFFASVFHLVLSTLYLIYLSKTF